MSPKREEDQTQAMEIDDAAAESAGGPRGAPPAEEAANVVPNSWQETLNKTWETTAGKINLGDAQIGYVSTSELLFDKANTLFEIAHRDVSERPTEPLPLPPNNADGSELTTQDQPIDTIVWPKQEVSFFDDDEEQNDG